MSSKPFTGKVGQMKPETKWLASEDFLGLGDVTLVLDGVFENKNETMQDGRKADFFSISFKKTKKHLVLNATNRKALANAFGADTKEWIGKEISMHTEGGIRNPKGGDPVNGLRIKTGAPDINTAPSKSNPFEDKPAEPVTDETEDIKWEGDKAE